jgi:nitrate reductase delta subunit
MIDLIKHYEAAGLYFDGKELPDHLCVVLEFASTQPPRQAREFLAELAHILNSIFSALRKRDSAYASLVAAVLELAGEKAEAVPVKEDESLDESWQEPMAFDGCSTAGQARPGQPQPIQIVRRATPPSEGART